MTRLECPDCGLPLEVCSDPKRKFYPFRRICYATMEREAAEAAYDALHNGEKAGWHDGSFTSWVDERSKSHPYPARAGVSTGVAETDLAPWDHFTTKRDASPIDPAILGEGAEASQQKDRGDQ